MARAPHPIRINSAAQAACGFAPAVAAEMPDDDFGPGARGGARHARDVT
jgi:hypothetical protein